MIRRLILRACAVAAMCGVLGCHRNSALEEFVFTGETQGTTYTVRVVAARLAPEQKHGIEQAIVARLDAIDRTFSTYRPDSEISRFNQLRDTTPVGASGDLAEVIRLAASVSAASGGAFDITVRPLVDAWGFGPGGVSQEQPSEAELQELRARVGYQKVVVDEARGTVRKTQRDVTCDLNAIAQGYTCDKVSADLDALGWNHHLVEIGGEVKARGTTAQGAPWKIGVEKPIIQGRALDRVVELRDKSLSTSGDYRNYRERNGVRVSHLIDPRSGRPITHTLASVSVIHDSCALADAYATALMVLGPDAGYDLAEKSGLAALFIVRESPDAFMEKSTPAFEDSLVRR